ncbi:MAG: NADH-quinone oxidoreductase subunit A [Methanobacteriota archaeon]|nr:MAG: NADH-quinone oxidoreductase subunit A [Euryarchaeota archaeon]
MTLLDAYVPVVLFLFVALMFPLITFFATRLFRPTHPTPLKDLTYECGELPEGEAAIQFHFQYYMFALIFVVFDVAAVFLVLWALMIYGTASDLGPGASAGDRLVRFAPVLAPMLLGFIPILFVATQYALKKESVIHI